MLAKAPVAESAIASLVASAVNSSDSPGAKSCNSISSGPDVLGFPLKLTALPILLATYLHTLITVAAFLARPAAASAPPAPSASFAEAEGIKEGSE